MIQMSIYHVPCLSQPNVFTTRIDVSDTTIVINDEDLLVPALVPAGLGGDATDTLGLLL